MLLKERALKYTNKLTTEMYLIGGEMILMKTKKMQKQ
jgi:hypothetical protein